MQLRQIGAEVPVHGHPTENSAQQGTCTDKRPPSNRQKCGVKRANMRLQHGEQPDNPRKRKDPGRQPEHQPLDEEGSAHQPGPGADELHASDEEPTCENGQTNGVVEQRHGNHQTDEGHHEQGRRQPVDGGFDVGEQVALPHHVCDARQGVEAGGGFRQGFGMGLCRQDSHVNDGWQRHVAEKRHERLAELLLQFRRGFFGVEVRGGRHRRV